MEGWQRGIAPGCESVLSPCTRQPGVTALEAALNKWWMAGLQGQIPNFLASLWGGGPRAAQQARAQSHTGVPDLTKKPSLASLPPVPAQPLCPTPPTGISQDHLQAMCISILISESALMGTRTRQWDVPKQETHTSSLTIRKGGLRDN